jgi:O-antigen ligase
MSLVRSAVLGLLTFLSILFYATNKRAFFIGGSIFALVAIVTSPYWVAAFNPEVAAERRGVHVEVMEYGSGRPRLWLHDLAVFADRPFDEQLAGAGIGNRIGENPDETVYGHNDWIEILTQTGVVGFLLFATLQALILKKILKLQGKERYQFLALFIAVNIMMFFSNSYAWRIQVSQVYYMVLAFIELPSNRSQTRTSGVQSHVSAA